MLDAGEQKGQHLSFPQGVQKFPNKERVGLDGIIRNSPQILLNNSTNGHFLQLLEQHVCHAY